MKLNSKKMAQLFGVVYPAFLATSALAAEREELFQNSHLDYIEEDIGTSDIANFQELNLASDCHKEETAIDLTSLDCVSRDVNFNALSDAPRNVKDE